MLKIISLLLFIAFSLNACQRQDAPPTSTGTAMSKANQSESAATINPVTQKITYPIMFVTQVPTTDDRNTRLSAFANHRTSVHDVPRGGDLMLRYPDGHLRNLTSDAGFGHSGLQESKAIAVREPSIHPSGNKAIFSLLLGSPSKNQSNNPYRWQLYEVEGLGRHQKAKITKVARQDSRFNNVSPLYADDGNIIFTSDRPRNGELHLYPQLDEYEATPSITGIWKLTPPTGALQLLSHTPSGAFNPLIDHFGRVIFTRWDHLQQDQLADRDRDAEHNKVALPFQSFNFVDETAHAVKLPHRQEVFPESRIGSVNSYGDVNAFRSNFFTIWQIDQDGANEETVNHVGLHELSFGYLTPSFAHDKNLSNRTLEQFHANRLSLRREGGLFHLREDPLQPGTFFGINARESASFTSDSIVKLAAQPGLNPEHMQVTAVTQIEKSDNLKDGRYRNPLPLSDGRLIASHTSLALPPEQEASLPDLRLRWLNWNSKNQLYNAGSTLTDGLTKKLSWWDQGKLVSYSGNLWELEAVEVRPRNRRPAKTASLESPERAILQAEQVDETQLRNWLQSQNLALIVTRNQTSRDRADLQQAYNLEVPGGIKQTSINAPKAQTYSIQHFQILQAEQIRAYADRPGRRNLAQPIKHFQQFNPDNLLNSSIPSSVVIAKDGSTAAFVPAARALTWQTTDPQGTPIVRERNWVSFKAGEIRVCASCHGVNQRDQSNFPAPMNPPEALRGLLQHWKKINK
ncbi:hypothetical protein [Undibacterium sp. Ji22W]|uniref:HzsA-related protein n=1 Tax=Undibacterium sp. Ji22W TaxID=3413038 RepID=UPI003BF1E494